MANITLIYAEDAEDFANPQTMMLTKGGIEDVYDVLVFLGEAMRAAGYTYVEHVGYVTSDDKEVWARF